MPVEVVLISNPAIDFDTLLSIAHEAMGRNIADAADASPRIMTDAEKFLSCLAALRDENRDDNGTITSVITPLIAPDLLRHVSFSILVIAEEHDLLAILEIASSMTFVRTETTAPGVSIAVVTGTLAQWKYAVVSGTDDRVSSVARTCYSKILLLFDRAGLTSVWNDYDRIAAPDRNGFRLEYRRR